MMQKMVRYFEEFGAMNTGEVIQAVLERLQEEGIGAVVVASSSGNTAIQFAESMRKAGREERIICVSDPPWARERFPESAGISSANRAKLDSLGVEIIDYMPYASVAYSWQASENVYGALDLLVVVFDAFRMLGETGLRSRSRWG